MNVRANATATAATQRRSPARVSRPLSFIRHRASLGRAKEFIYRKMLSPVGPTAWNKVAMPKHNLKEEQKAHEAWWKTLPPAQQKQYIQEWRQCLVDPTFAAYREEIEQCLLVFRARVRARTEKQALSG
jgi:hypothetical protein